MTKERCFTFVKPDFMENVAEIYTYFTRRLQDMLGSSGGFWNFDITGIFSITVKEEALRKHYAHVLKSEDPEVRKVGESMIRAFSGKEIAGEIYIGETGLVRTCREITGPTDPHQADDNTIRGKFCKHYVNPLKYYKSRGIPTPNAFHCSASPKEAETEIKLWKPYFPKDLFLDKKE